MPAIVISPFAKTGFVDHTEHDTLSILKTIEERFGLPPLSRYDAAASDLLSNFTLRTDITGQVRVRTSDPDLDPKGGTFSVDVTVSNPEHAPGSHGQDNPTLQGAFGLFPVGLALASSAGPLPRAATPVLVAMQAELDHSLSALKSQPVPPYFLSYEITETRSLYVSSVFGDLERSTELTRSTASARPSACSTRVPFELI